jgi:hypothetical protein
MPPHMKEHFSKPGYVAGDLVAVDAIKASGIDARALQKSRKPWCQAAILRAEANTASSPQQPIAL